MVQLKWLGRYGPIACILWYERLGQISRLFHCQHRKSRFVEMLPVDRFQSTQCIIIHHTHNESLEWSSSSGWVYYRPVACILWYERLGQICHFVHCQHRKSRLVEMLPVDGFQSGQCIIIHHTHNESLEWSSSSGWVHYGPIA